MREHRKKLFFFAFLLFAGILMNANALQVKASPLAFADATNIKFNTCYTGTIPAYTYTDSDYKYKIDVKKAGLLEICTKGTGDYLVFDKNGDKMDKVWIGDLAEYSYKIYVNSGEYYLQLCGNDKDFDKNFTLTAALTETKESYAETSEKNDDLVSSANQITLGSTYKGQVVELSTQKDLHDVYAFEVPMDGQVTLTVKIGEIVGNATGMYTILDAKQNEIENTAIYETSKETTYDLKKGTYYLSMNNNVPVAYGNPGYSYEFKTKYKATASTKITKVTRKGTTATVKFNGVKGAKRYVVAYSTSKNFPSKSTTLVKTTKTSLTLKKLDKTKTYYVKVRPYAKIGKKYYAGSYSAKKELKK